MCVCLPARLVLHGLDGLVAVALVSYGGFFVFVFERDETGGDG